MKKSGKYYFNVNLRFPETTFIKIVFISSYRSCKVQSFPGHSNILVSDLQNWHSMFQSWVEICGPCTCDLGSRRGGRWQKGLTGL